MKKRTECTYQQVVNAYRANTLADLAENNGLPVSTLYRDLEKYALALGFFDITGFMMDDPEAINALIAENKGKRKSKKRALVNEAWRLLSAGWDTREVAILLGVSAVTVTKWMNESPCPERIPGLVHKSAPSGSFPLPFPVPWKPASRKVPVSAYVEVPSIETLCRLVFEEKLTLSEIAAKTGAMPARINKAFFSAENLLYLVNVLHYTPSQVAEMCGVSYYSVSQKILNYNRTGAGISHRPDHETLVCDFEREGSTECLAKLYHITDGTAQKWLRDVAEAGYKERIAAVRHLYMKKISCRVPNKPAPAELVELRKTMSIPDIMAKYNVSDTAVKYWIREAREAGFGEEMDRISRERTGRSKSSWSKAGRKEHISLSNEEIIRLVEKEGKSTEEIARDYGYAESSIKGMLAMGRCSGKESKTSMSAHNDSSMLTPELLNDLINVQGLSQTDVARLYDLTIPQVARRVKQARKKGVFFRTIAAETESKRAARRTNQDLLLIMEALQKSGKSYEEIMTFLTGDENI